MYCKFNVYNNDSMFVINRQAIVKICSSVYAHAMPKNMHCIE